MIDQSIDGVVIGNDQTNIIAKCSIIMSAMQHVNHHLVNQSKQIEILLAVISQTVIVCRLVIDRNH